MDVQTIPQASGFPFRKVLLHTLLFLVVFAAGGVTGAVLMPGFGRDAGRDNRPPRDRSGSFEREAAAQIAHRYGLAPQDEEKVFAIIKANSEKLRALHKDFFPKMEACWTETNAKIRDVLPAQKREEYDRDVQARQKRMFRSSDSPERGPKRDDGERRGARERGPEPRPATAQDGQAGPAGGVFPPPPPKDNAEGR